MLNLLPITTCMLWLQVELICWEIDFLLSRPPASCVPKKAKLVHHPVSPRDLFSVHLHSHLEQTSMPTLLVFSNAALPLLLNHSHLESLSPTVKYLCSANHFFPELPTQCRKELGRGKLRSSGLRSSRKETSPMGAAEVWSYPNRKERDYRDEIVLEHKDRIKE